MAANGIRDGALPLRRFPADIKPATGMNMNNPTSSTLRFVLFATSVTAIGGFLFGYDTAVINSANSYLKAHIFGFKTGSMGAMFQRAIGFVRNRAGIIMTNLVYNLARTEQIIRLKLLGRKTPQSV
jgi:hypothetical protein